MGDSYPGGQGVLTFSQIENLWTNNGGDPRWAPLMASIAEAESNGGHPGVLNDTPSTGDYSVGLWQINYFQSLMLPRTQSYGAPSVLWNDPNAQAKAAISIFANGAGAGAWQGDNTWKVWKANGAPMYPTQAQLANWGAPTGSSGGVPYTGGNAGGAGSTTGGQAQAPGGISLPLLGTIITGQQEIQIKGWFLMISGSLVAAVGLAVLLASFGLESKAGQLLNVVPGGAAVKGATKARRASKAAASTQANKMQLEQEKGSQKRATAAMGPGPKSAGQLRQVSTTEQRRNKERVARAKRDLTPRERQQAESF